MALESSQRFEEAVVCYDNALDIDSSDKDLWISKGVALEWLERLSDALACYDQALNLDLENRFVHFRRGQVMAKMGRHQDAVQAYDRALVQLLENHLGLPCVVGYPLRGIDTSAVDLGADRRAAVTEWALCAGLAIRGADLRAPAQEADHEPRRLSA